MRALVLQDGRAEVRDDVPEPTAGAGQTRVRITTVGVCATDLALRAGYMGFAGVPGHEFVGVAENGPLAGRRVVGEINAGCGTCALCVAGDPRHCASRTVLGILGHSGAFAERLVLPDANLLPVPDDVSDDEAVFAEPLAAALAIPAELGDLSGQRALVAGDGRLGLLCAHAVARAGAQLTVAGHHAERASLLPAGAALRTDLLEADSPPGRGGFDLAVEATGHPDVLARLLGHVRPRGTVVLKTTAARPATLDLAPLVVDELRLIGSRCGRFAPAVAALAEHSLPLQGFVQARYPLARADEALERAGQRGVLKVLVDVPGDG